jgi:hypothetical protein
MAPKDRRSDEKPPVIPEIPPAGGTGTLDAAHPDVLGGLKGFLKVLGPGLLTGVRRPLRAWHLHHRRRIHWLRYGWR